MSLSLINSTGNNQSAQGQLVTVSFTLLSSEILTGNVLRVNPALWLSNAIDSTNTSWQVTYPMSTPIGGVEMNYVGVAVNENYSLNIEVIDSYRFKLIYKYFNLYDLNGYLNDVNYNNSQVFLSSSVANKDLVLDVENVNNSDQIYVGVASTVSGFSSGINIDVTGFNPNSDLVVNLTSQIQSISNTWYVGFVDITSITSTSPFAQDFSLNYGEVSNGVSAVEDLPIDVFQGGSGFTWNGNESTAQVSIKSSELDVNKVYKLYAIYRESGVWKSYVSPQLVALSSDRDQILAEYTTSITDVFGNVHDSGCVSNISACGELTFCATLDLVSYDAALSAAGILGSFSDYYKSGGIYVSQGEPTEALLGQVIRSTETLTSSELTLCFTVNDDSLSGQKYYTFSIKTTIDGVDDYQNIVIPVYYSKVLEVEPSIQLNGADVDRICIEENSYDIVNLDDGCMTMVSLNGGVYNESPIIVENNIDPTALEESDLVCLKTTCDGVSVPTGTCICPPCPNMVVDVASSYDEDLNLGVTTFTSEVGSIISLVGPDDTNGTNTIDVDYFGLPNFPYDLIVTKDGCTWNYSGSINSNTGNNGEFQINIEGSGTIDCDCDEGCNPCPDCKVTTDVTIEGQIDFGTNDFYFNLESPIGTVLTVNGDTNGNNQWGIGGINPKSSYDFIINVVDDDGCEYQGSRNFSAEGQFTDWSSPADDFTIELSTCTNPINCDEVICNNNAWFTATCDDETGDIVATAFDDFESVVVTDVISTLTGNTELVVTREVTFEDDCDPLYITETFTCEVLVGCDNTLLIDYTNVGGLVTLTETENFSSGIASDTDLKYSIDGGVTFLDYSLPVQLSDGETIIWSRTVIFDDGCEGVSGSGNTSYTAVVVDPTPSECDSTYSPFDLTIFVDDDNSTFTVDKVGNEEYLEVNELLWTAMGVDPFDSNGSGLPYMGAVTMRGIFIAAWKIKFVSCPEKIIYKTAYLKPEVKVCELPPIEWSADNPTLEVCVKECPPCGCEFDVDIDGCAATLINLNACEGFSFKWYDPNGVLIGTGVGPFDLTIDGIHTIEATGADCTDNIEFIFNLPNSGEVIDNPILI